MACGKAGSADLGQSRAPAPLGKEAKLSTPRFAERQRLGGVCSRRDPGCPRPGKVKVDAAACSGWKQRGQPELAQQDGTGCRWENAMDCWTRGRPRRGMCKLAFALQR